MATKLRVLYLESNEDVREMVSLTLEAAGIDLATADCVREAERLAFSNDHDIFLLDGVTPFEHNLELCRKLRAHAPDAPILFYSA